MNGTEQPRLRVKVLLGPAFAKHPDTTRLKPDSLVPAISEALGLRSINITIRGGIACCSCHLGPCGPMFGH